MIDDREHTLFKLLCRLSDKTSIDCPHGIIYVTVSLTSEDRYSNYCGYRNFSYLFDLIRHQISSAEIIVKLSDNTFVIVSSTCSDERISLLTHSIRNLATQFEENDCTRKISIGAALFNQACTTIPDLLDTVCELAFQSRSENTVVYENLIREINTQHSIVVEAA